MELNREPPSYPLTICAASVSHPSSSFAESTTCETIRVSMGMFYTHIVYDTRYTAVNHMLVYITYIYFHQCVFALYQTTYNISLLWSFSIPSERRYPPGDDGGDADYEWSIQRSDELCLLNGFTRRTRKTYYKWHSSAAASCSRVGKLAPGVGGWMGGGWQLSFQRYTYRVSCSTYHTNSYDTIYTCPEKARYLFMLLYSIYTSNNASVHRLVRRLAFQFKCCKKSLQKKKKHEMYDDAYDTSSCTSTSITCRSILQ